MYTLIFLYIFIFMIIFKQYIRNSNRFILHLHTRFLDFCIVMSLIMLFFNFDFKEDTFN